MKIKSRDEKMREYNERYPIRISDIDSLLESTLRDYVDKQKNPEKVIQKARNKALAIINKREYESIHILMYEYPFKTDRPRSFNGHTWSPNAAEHKAYFEKALKKINKTIKMINTPGEIEIEAYLEMPSTVPPDEVILFECKLLKPVDKPDYDNIGKCYTDMFTWILTTDDDIFWRGEIRKYYSLIPRVHITIRYLKKHESDYIYKKLKSRKTIKQGIASGQIVLEKLEVS